MIAWMGLPWAPGQHTGHWGWRQRCRCTLLATAVVLGAHDRLAAQADTPARVVLLPSADRASVVVEVDSDVQHTSIRTLDDRTLIVEIGPVKSRVVNQLLQAATASPLVSQVRVRGITRGTEGTLIALQIVGKSSISGSVRRVQRRVYVDLEPLSAATAAVARSQEPVGPSTPGTRPTATETKSTPVSPRPSTAPDAAPPDSAPSRKPSRAMPPTPQVARERVRDTPSATVPGASVSTSPSSTVIGRAEALALIPDVKGLERLKAEALEARSASAAGTAGGANDAARATSDAVVVRLDALLTEARQQQLLADAKLFRGSSPAAAVASSAPPSSPAPPLGAQASAPSTPRARVPTPSPTAMAPPATGEQVPAGGFQQAMRQLRPELERVNGTISVLTPGAVLSGEVPAQIESVLSKLRALHPPGELGSSHERACGALSSLLTGWVRAPDGQWVIAIGGDPTTLENTRAAMFDYLRAFDRFDRQGAPLTMSRAPGQ